MDHALLPRHEDGTVEVRLDRHLEGLFSQATWLELLAGVGFEAVALPDAWDRAVFVGRRPPVARDAAPY